MTTSSDLILTARDSGVTTLTMNMPRRYNGWTFEMMHDLRAALEREAANDDTKVLILTGADPYYCAGVNLAGTLKLDHPKKLHASIAAQNAALFDMFLDFPKPIIAAVNGPAIGAAVTTATLCDAIVASEKATFSLPFARLGVPPEGCSSYVFPEKFGQEVTRRIMGPEGWTPTAQEALEIGLVDKCVPHEDLLKQAHKLAKTWIKKGRERTYPAGATREQLKAINAQESQALATAFLSPPFLQGQFNFLMSRKKYGPAAMFLVLLKTRPIWSLLL